MNGLVSCLKTLNSYFKLDDERAVRIGSFQISEEPIQTRELVTDKIKKFGGIGWVQTAGKLKSEIINGVHAPTLSLDPDSWIVTAEFANGHNSLHVYLCNQTWKLVHISEVTGDGVILPLSLLKLGGGRLDYAVAFTDRDGALTPSTYRFTGFGQ